MLTMDNHPYEVAPSQVTFEEIRGCIRVDNPLKVASLEHYFPILTTLDSAGFLTL